MKMKIAMAILLATFSLQVLADDAVVTPAPSAKTRTKKAGSPAVLDFEADVIEGERKTPSLFLQLETETTDIDALLFQRNSFNDQQDLEKDRRPMYRKPQ